MSLPGTRLQQFVLVTVVAIAAVWIFLKSGDLDQSGESEGASEKSVDIRKNTGSKRKPVTEMTANEVADLSDSESFQQVHHDLALQLMSELEALGRVTDRALIRVRLKPTAEKFYFLSMAVKKSGVGELDYQRLSPEHKERIENLSKLWRTNPNLAREADLVYSQLNLLDHEHVPYLLRYWLQPIE